MIEPATDLEDFDPADVLERARTCRARYATTPAAVRMRERRAMAEADFAATGILERETFAAIHESAHAAMAFAVGVKVIEIVTTPWIAADNTRGKCWLSCPDYRRCDGDRTSLRPDVARRHMLISLAGPAAAVLTGGDPREGAAGDMAEARECAIAIAGHRHRRAAVVLERGKVQAIGFVEVNEAAIRAIADELMGRHWPAMPGTAVAAVLAKFKIHPPR